MSVAIISFRNGCVQAYYKHNWYNNDKVVKTLDIGYEPAGDHPLTISELCRNEIKPFAFDIANAYAQGLEGILSFYSSHIDYVEKNWLKLKTERVYVTYSDQKEFFSVNKLFDKYGINATYWKEQHLMALSCDYRDDICCRIIYDNKFCDAHYCPYDCEIINSGNCPVPTNLGYKVEKTFRLRDNEVTYFLIACATLRYCADKHYHEFCYKLHESPFCILAKTK